MNEQDLYRMIEQFMQIYAADVMPEPEVKTVRDITQWLEWYKVAHEWAMVRMNSFAAIDKSK